MSTLICRVELNKKEGIILTVENKEEKRTQTIVIDGTSIITTSAGKKETSTITQTDETISFKCKNFTVEAETIKCTSSKDTDLKSSGEFSVLSDKDISLESKKNINQIAHSALKGTAQTTNFTSKQSAEFSASKTSIKGKSQVSISGAKLNLNGSTQSELSGAMVKLKAGGVMNVEGQMTTLKGQLTNIQGSLVNIG
jgi:hypothetical protein